MGRLAARSEGGATFSSTTSLEQRIDRLHNAQGRISFVLSPDGRDRRGIIRTDVTGIRSRRRRFAVSQSAPGASPASYKYDLADARHEVEYSRAGREWFTRQGRSLAEEGNGTTVVPRSSANCSACVTERSRERSGASEYGALGRLRSPPRAGAEVVTSNATRGEAPRRAGGEETRFTRDASSGAIARAPGGVKRPEPRGTRGGRPVTPEASRRAVEKLASTELDFDAR